MAYASQMVKKGRSLQKKVKSKTVKKTKSKPVKKTKSKPVKKNKSKTVKKTKSKRSKKTVKKFSKAKQHRGGILDEGYAESPEIETIKGKTFYFKGTKKAGSGFGRKKTRYFYLIPIIETRVNKKNDEILGQTKKLKIYSCEDPNIQCTPEDNYHKVYEIDPNTITHDIARFRIIGRQYHSENKLIIKNIKVLNGGFRDLTGAIKKFQDLKLRENIDQGGKIYNEKIKSDLEEKMKNAFPIT